MYSKFKISTTIALLFAAQVQSIPGNEGLNLYPEGALEQDVPNDLKGSQGDVSTENQLPMESHDVHGQSPLIGYDTGNQNSPANTKIQAAKSPKHTAKGNPSKSKDHHTKIQAAKSPKQTAKANPSKGKGHHTKIQSAKSPKQTAKHNPSKGKGHHTTTRPVKVLITSVKVTHTKPAHSSKPPKETKPPSKGIQKGKKCNISSQECAAGLTCVHQGYTKDLKGICLPKDDLEISTRTSKTKLHHPRHTKTSQKVTKMPNPTKDSSKGIQKGQKCNIAIQGCAAGLTCVHQGYTKDLKGICLQKDDLEISTRTRKTKLHNPRPTKTSHKSKNVPKPTAQNSLVGSGPNYSSPGDFYGSIHSDMSSDGSMLSGFDGSFPTDVAGSVSSDDSALNPTETGDVVVDSAGTLSNAAMIGFLAFFLL